MSGQGNAVAALTCRELIGFLAEYLDGELPAAEAERFDAHLAICPACVDYLASYREIVRAAGRAFEDDDAIPATVPEELIRAVLEARRG